MKNLNSEQKEIFEIGNKKYTVITKKSKESLDKEKLIKLIVGYAMQEIKQEDF